MKTISKIYFDMDGVVANFDKAMFAEFKKEDATWDNVDRWIVREAPNSLFYNLEEMPDFDLLKSFIIKLSQRIPVEFLTSTGDPNVGKPVVKIARDKTMWLGERGLGHIRVNFVHCGKRKDLYAAPGVLLIDDWDDNIIAFQKAGGETVKYTSFQDMVEKLKEFNVTVD